MRLMLLSALFSMAVVCEAQLLHAPMDIPLLLSGNFGELRSNHFHSGIDIKTQGVEGKVVRAAEEGTIARVVVSPWGYGKALYLTHPNGLTTVYAHLSRFTPAINAYILEEQYARERFDVDLSLPPDLFPVKKGEVIAYSGNSGSSGGPHLHFEIRDTETNEPIDPLPYFKTRIKDLRAPKVRGLMICPLEGEGLVNGSSKKQKMKLTTTKEGLQLVGDKIEAWGKVGIALNMADYMSGTTNVYGVKEITVEVDGEETFYSYLDRFSFQETRLLNAWVDYAEWKNKRTFFTKLFVDPGNTLRFISGKAEGILTIDEERTYQVVVKMTDAYGNSSRLTIPLLGRKQQIKRSDREEIPLFSWQQANRFETDDCRLFTPVGALAHSFHFRYGSEADSTLCSDRHHLHDTPFPLFKKSHLALRLLGDSLLEKRHYGVVTWDRKRLKWLGGTYQEGWLTVDVMEGGRYGVMVDTVAPKIAPIAAQEWMTKGTIALRLSDNLSGIATYRGEIDGEYALFELDGKRSVVHYHLDRTRLKRGKHTLVFKVTDQCGNPAKYTTSFTW